MHDLPDPASVGAPGEDLIGRMANAMFRAATQSVAWPGGLPSGTGTPQGGFGAALPSTPLPDAFAPTVTAPSAVPAGALPIEPGTPLGGSATPLAGVPPVNTALPGVEASLPSGSPGIALGGFGAPLPSMPLPDAGVPSSAIPFAAPADPATIPSDPGGARQSPVPTASAIPPHGSATPDGFSGTPAAPPHGGFGASLPAAAAPELGTPGFGVPVSSDTSLFAPDQAVPSGTLPNAGYFGSLRAPSIPDVPPLGLIIPGEDELRALLAAATLPSSPPQLQNDTTPQYYFLTQPDLAVAPSAEAFDANLVRRDFPILSERVHGRPLIWFDNAATTQKPRVVIDRLSYFYEHENSNIHRAAHELAARSTDAYEKARETVRRFINAGSADEIVFVRGTTEAINLISNTWGRRFVGKDDEIVITWLEHHANIVPWQMLCEQTGAILRVAPVDERGQVKLDDYGKLLGPRTKLVSFASVSNALGTITPAKVMTEMAHAAGARVLLDAAQSVSHMRSDVQALDVDWFVFSGHKVFGPTGIGAVYGKPEVLAESPPWQGGGNMIDDVTFERTLYKAPPSRFEAGTGNIADAVGLGAALEYVERVGIDAIGRYEHDLLTFATRLLGDIPGLRIIGTAPEKAGVISFVLDGIEPIEVGTALNEEGIAVRAGHHCAQPILRRFGLESTVRLSLALYNTHAEIDAFAAAVRRIQSKRAPHHVTRSTG
jgi:cysteine desulfurase/selenocysteine lyase